jgi:hypothetical protein
MLVSVRPYMSMRNPLFKYHCQSHAVRRGPEHVRAYWRNYEDHMSNTSWR